MDQKEIASFYDQRGSAALSSQTFYEIAPSFRAPYKFAHKRIGEILPVGATILDFACGTGLHALAFAQAGFQVTGVDLSEKSIAAANSLCQQHGVSRCQFLVGDQSLPGLADQQFDAIFVSGALYYLDLDSYGAWFKAHLRPGGYFLAVETLGSNWLMSVFRRIRNSISHHRDEQTLNHLLTVPALANFGAKLGEYTIHYFDCLTLAGRLLKRWPAAEAAYVSMVASLDRFIVERIANNLAFKVVLEARKESL